MEATAQITYDLVPDRMPLESPMFTELFWCKVVPASRLEKLFAKSEACGFTKQHTKNCLFKK